jgi:hypothetical protein
MTMIINILYVEKTNEIYVTMVEQIILFHWYYDAR